MQPSKKNLTGKCVQSDQATTERNSEDELSVEGIATVLALLFCVIVTVGFFAWSGVGFDSPLSRYQTTPAGTVTDLAYLHGLGTRTQIRTTADLYLVVDAAHVRVGDEMVLQTNEYARRLCIRATDHCWRVIN